MIRNYKRTIEIFFNNNPEFKNKYPVTYAFVHKTTLNTMNNPVYKTIKKYHSNDDINTYETAIDYAENDMSVMKHKLIKRLHKMDTTEKSGLYNLQQNFPSFLTLFTSQYPGETYAKDLLYLGAVAYKKDHTATIYNTPDDIKNIIYDIVEKHSVKIRNDKNENENENEEDEEDENKNENKNENEENENENNKDKNKQEKTNKYYMNDYTTNKYITNNNNITEAYKPLQSLFKNKQQFIKFMKQHQTKTQKNK